MNTEFKALIALNIILIVLCSLLLMRVNDLTTVEHDQGDIQTNAHSNLSNKEEPKSAALTTAKVPEQAQRLVRESVTKANESNSLSKPIVEPGSESDKQLLNPRLDEESRREIETVHLKDHPKLKEGVTVEPPAADVAWLNELERLENAREIKPIGQIKPKSQVAQKALDLGAEEQKHASQK